MKNKYIFLSLAILGSLALVGPASAATTSTTGVSASVGTNFRGGAGWSDGTHGAPMRPGAGTFGKVTAISGTTITISGMTGPKGGTATTYTVDASNATVTKDGAASTVSAIAVGDTIAVQGTVTGTNVVAKTIRDGVAMRMGMGVFGTVASINGTTLTVTSKAPNNGAATTYTVDASNATVTKNGSASTLASVAVGDTVGVQGTINGTSVTAKTIRDGVKPMPTPVITGNGEPVIAGSITAISGTTLTVTNKSNITYTVDASNATIEKSNAASTLSSVAVGDNVVIQGTVNGTAVTASSVMDQGSATNANGAPKGPMGFLGSIKQFFQHMFGF